MAVVFVEAFIASIFIVIRRNQKFSVIHSTVKMELVGTATKCVPTHDTVWYRYVADHNLSPQVLSFSLFRDQVSHPNKTTKVRVLYILLSLMFLRTGLALISQYPFHVLTV